MENSEVIIKTKNSKVLIILLILSVLIIAGLIGYIIYDKNNTDDDKKVVEEETKKEKFIYPEKLTDHTFIKMDEKTIKINKENHKLITYYYYDIEHKEVEGIENDWYLIKKEVYLDNKRIYDLHTFNYLSKDESNLSYTDIVDEDIKLSKPLVNDYINNNEYVLITEYTNEHLDSYAILVDSKGNVLRKFQTSIGNTGLWVDDKDINKNTDGYMEHSFNIQNNHNILYVGKNYLYYLAIDKCYGQTEYSEDYFVDEYLIKIENGNLNEVKTITYDRTKVQGAGGLPDCRK